MKPDFRSLRVRQLARSIEPFVAAKTVARPRRGWLRAIREATGIPLAEVARRLGSSRQLPAQLEKSEAEYRITLKSLREFADAMGCELVYGLVPKSGSIEELAESRARQKAAEQVLAVEHSMALEDQAVGGVEQKIGQETRKMMSRSRRNR